jgi:hypothetical protein
MATSNNSSFREVLRKLFPHDFRERRRERAARRKSLWNVVLLALMFTIASALYITMLYCIWGLRTKLATSENRALIDVFRQESNSNGFAWFVFFAAPFVSSFPPAMYVANATLWRVPAARKTFEREAGDQLYMSYDVAQDDLRRASRWFLPIGIGLAGVGVVFL